MSHQIHADLTDLSSLESALKELRWYLGQGGYQLESATAEGSRATWSLDSRAPVGEKGPEKHQPLERRRVVEPGDRVVVETKAAQMARRFQGAAPQGVEGVVFRVLTRGPHPRGMKVELRDRTVGRVQQNLTMPGAGEPHATGRS